LVVTTLEDGDVEEIKTVSIYEIDEEDWRQLLIDYLEHRKLPSESRHKIEVQWRASRFIYYEGNLYRRFFLSFWLRCLDNEEGKQVIEEAYAGVCGAH